MYTLTELKEAADALEAKARLFTVANQSEAGYWYRIALAAEALAGASTSANNSISGWQRRTADALETKYGVSPAQENDNEPGALLRMITALETSAGASTSQSFGHRLQRGAKNILIDRVALDFKNGTYDVNGVLSRDITTIPGYAKDGTNEIISNEGYRVTGLPSKISVSLTDPGAEYFAAVVFQPSRAAGADEYVLDAPSSDGGRWLLARQADGLLYLFHTNIGFFNSTVAAAAGTRAVLGVRFSGGAIASFMRGDGGSTVKTQQITVAKNTITGLGIGSHGNGVNHPAVGDIELVLVRQGTFSDADMIAFMDAL